MGIRAHPRLTNGKTSSGSSWHPVSWLRRADRSSISSFHLADLGQEVVPTNYLISDLVVFVAFLSCCRLGRPWLIPTTTCQHRPKRYGQACWRGQLPAYCGGAASMPARSMAIGLASPHLVVAPRRRGQPARTAFSGTCCPAWRFCPGSCDPRSTPALAPGPARRRSRVPA